MDLHCHLDLYPDALKLLPEVAKRNQFTLVVTTSPRAWVATSRVFSGHENVKVALGLHPEIAERKANERNLLLSFVAQAPFIGEVGLDGSPRFRSSLPLQQEIFDAVVAECERQGGRVISLHSRGATTEVLNILENHPSAGKPILHWFSGTSRELQRAIELGCWFSVGPAMLSGAKGRELLGKMPAAKVLPETDGPFATVNKVPLMPWQAKDVVPVLTQVWREPADAVNAKLASNLHRLLE
ncbi:Qat anti-phage system TatD family nuclease QatD [Burkholderia pseudomallei]|uniref:Qat anti-phage system TatD family nuclease QatD n=1 Tax=Burkholderia pseudomallei TaxID=28450 RepID=UPI00201B24F1|nr:Qat anti-phage system TatD family nuclease QatD [Burkholderia pseudomallei]MCL4670373.1 TatD family hydrolase [Burkholderia pseudomallei]